MTPTYWFIAGMVVGMILMKLIDKVVAGIVEMWKY